MGITNTAIASSSPSLHPMPAEILPHSLYRKVQAWQTVKLPGRLVKSRSRHIRCEEAHRIEPGLNPRVTYDRVTYDRVTYHRAIAARTSHATLNPNP